VASGFKGSIVSLAEITLAGTAEAAAAQVLVHFKDRDGLVHAMTKHRIALTREADPELYDAARVLHDLLQARISALHFTEPDGGVQREREEVTHGISEALRGQLDPADDVGSQG
jgi:hypothetical protein